MQQTHASADSKTMPSRWICLNVISMSLKCYSIGYPCAKILKKKDRREKADK